MMLNSYLLGSRVLVIVIITHLPLPEYKRVVTCGKKDRDRNAPKVLVVDLEAYGSF